VGAGQDPAPRTGLKPRWRLPLTGVGETASRIVQPINTKVRYTVSILIGNGHGTLEPQVRPALRAYRHQFTAGHH
jgi:hypothetical protein